MQVKKKKRRLKKGFKRFILIVFLILFALLTYFLNKKGVIDINNILINPIKNIFKKEEIKKQDTSIQNLNNFAELFKIRLGSKGLEFASSSEIAPNGDMKIYLKNTLNDSGYLYVNTNDKPDYVWITFVSAIDSEPLKTKLQKNIKNLDYIDLRFSNKVFFKFKDTSIDVSTPTSKPKSTSTTSSTTQTDPTTPNLENIRIMTEQVSTTSTTN